MHKRADSPGHFMADSTKPRALIIDPSLHSPDGHHLGVLQRFQTELANLQVGSVSLVSLGASEELGHRENLIPAFGRGIYYRSQWTQREFHDCAANFCADLDSAIRKLRDRPELFVLPAADQATILGLAHYLKRHRRRKPPVVLLWLMMAPHYKKSIHDPSIGPHLAEYNEAFHALRKAVADDSRLHVCCETNAMARAYEPHVGLKIETVIVHKLIQQPRNRRVRQPGEPINIVCAGNANAAKGYFLLPETIHRLNRKRGDLRFLIHGTVEKTDYPQGRQILLRLSSLSPNVTVRTDVLSTDDYLAWLTQADLILLPYDPYIYKTRGSGICSEAAKLGIPVVATKDCDFAKDAIEERRVVGIEAFNAESVASAVLIAVDRLEEMTACAADYAARHSVDEHFARLLSAAAAATERRTSWFDRMLGW
jgi:glycosyltransferase involved in cell wall biosynthesis